MTGPRNRSRRQFLATTATAIAGLGWRRELGMLGTPMSLQHQGPLSALGGATTWLNSPPLTAGALRGHVVLVDFWTYTCINWLRTLPYVRAWAEKYRDNGLVVIGVHTPEFGFEHDIENVRRAVNAMHVEYPVAVDNDYAIWRGFDNQAWPALYILDGKGVLRHQQFGEGAYDEAEGVIQQLLGGGNGRVTPDARGIEVAADWDNLRSPESYLGTDRAEHFVSGAPKRLRLNDWALDGEWARAGQPVRLNSPNGRIVLRFHARDVHLVMGPAMKGTTVRYRVRLDGQAPGAARGIDTDEQGQGAATEQRLYQLIRQPRPIVDHQFEIEFLDPGIEAFAFTFG